MNPREEVSYIRGFWQIFAMVSLIIGFPLTIIGGVLLGMFFLYPLANVIPDELYILAFEEEFTVLAGLLGFGIFLLIMGMIFLMMGIAEDYNLRIQTESIKKRERNKKNDMIIRDEIGMSEQEMDKLMRKNILRDK